MMRLRIVSPEKVLFHGEVESVLVPGSLGPFEILKDHAPIVSTLTKGHVEYKTQDGKKQFNIIGGFVEVKRNEVSLCVEV
mgnify:CR=1 FL=1